MILPVKQTLLMAALILLSATCPGFAQQAGIAAASSTPKAMTDINKAQIAGQETITKPETAATDLFETSGTVPLPVEIPAIDNLLNLNASAGLNLVASYGISSVGPLLEPEPRQTASGRKEIADLPHLATESTIISSGTAQPENRKPSSFEAPGKGSGFVNTLFPDPLSPDFPGNDGVSTGEKSRSADELIEEFNRQAEEIASRTAAELETANSVIEKDQLQRLEKIPVNPAEKVVEQTAASLPVPVEASASQPLVTADEPGRSNEPIESAEPPAEVIVEENIISEVPADEPVDEQDQVASEAEIIPVSWPDSDEDPEFASGATKLPTSIESAQTASTSEQLFEKAEALEPALMTAGKPEEDEADANETQKLSGLVVPEKHPIGGRRHLFRWVLKTDDGKRIPLKSNLRLLSEVRLEKILDGRVTLNGHFVKSPLNKELRYFVIESATVANTPEASGTARIKNKKGVASATAKLKRQHAER
ncbi:MAG: hypothetical protein PHD82_09755 [Candidatus Riflebacteria bacterium]|nr:hypothetical protein [Candidatus Riflebacteria bacterium]